MTSPPAFLQFSDFHRLLSANACVIFPLQCSTLFTVPVCWHWKVTQRHPHARSHPGRHGQRISMFIQQDSRSWLLLREGFLCIMDRYGAREPVYACQTPSPSTVSHPIWIREGGVLLVEKVTDMRLHFKTPRLVRRTVYWAEMSLWFRDSICDEIIII